MIQRYVVFVLLGVLGLAVSPTAWGQTPQDPNCSAANLMLVVDVSGSMSEGGKLKGLQTAIDGTIDTFKSKLRLGLIAFSGTQAKLLVQVGPENMKDAAAVSAHVANLKKAVQGLQALGTTPMTAAMKLAKSNYEQVIPNDALHKDPNPKTQRRSFVLLATDGEPTDGDPLPLIKALRTLKVGAKEYDIRTFVVGLGTDQQIRPFQLKQFAIAGGTQDFLQALTPDDLKQFFEDISNSAAKEVCDGRDNDCDGLVDEDLEQDCKSDCGKGKQICQAGKWGPCNAPQPKDEICNGRDENCNGQVDEGLTRACQTACGSGQQSCIQGDWSSCSAPRPEPEVCDGKDNDCDGQIDNGNLCVGGKCVMKGQTAQCEIKCKGNECPVGYDCDRPTQLCIAGPCTNFKCKPGEICSSKTGQPVCEDVCKGISCPVGKTCGNNGICVDCYKDSCPPQMFCYKGSCVVDQCTQIACNQGQGCSVDPDSAKAKCFDSCAGVKCSDGDVCVEGSCTRDVCAKVTCPDGQYCNPVSGDCAVNKCLTKTSDCGTDNKLVCDPGSGSCIDSPCSGVTCPSGTTCWLGQCVGDSDPKPWPKGRCGEATDCGAPGMTCKLGFCAKAGTTGPKDTGCGCQSVEPSPWSALWLGLFGLFFLSLRRRQSHARG
ncbi:MAG: VWA domain-containing protein [Deltaproteobacteria bacterium]|nr:MAG: VWA domain-containing protein [Deltaproteobacteria bacterium]